MWLLALCCVVSFSADTDVAKPATAPTAAEWTWQQRWSTSALDLDRLQRTTAPYLDRLQDADAGTPKAAPSLPRRIEPTVAWLHSLVSLDVSDPDAATRHEWRDGQTLTINWTHDARSQTKGEVGTLRFAWSGSTEDLDTSLVKRSTANVLLTYEADQVASVFIVCQMAPGAPVDVQTHELWTLDYDDAGALTGGRVLSWTKLNGEVTKGEQSGWIWREPAQSQFFDKRRQAAEPKAFWELVTHSPGAASFGSSSDR